MRSGLRLVIYTRRPGHRGRSHPERHKPVWVFAVYGGIVRAVYRIESWERPPEEKRVGNGVGRWDFNAVRDLAMEDIYLWTDVSGYLPRGAQNPITYVHC
jgi:hypothetical protein